MCIRDRDTDCQKPLMNPFFGVAFLQIGIKRTVNSLLRVDGDVYKRQALGPSPLATMGNSEWRSTGQNYLKSLLALGFQAFLIMIVVGIYAVLIRNISGAADIAGAIWGCMGYTVLLCFCLFKTGSISKSVFGAH